MINDIKREQSDKKLPLWDRIPFLHPDRIQKKAVNRISPVAHIELLLGPWLLIPYAVDSKEGRREGLHFYYDGTGSSIEEFTFIFDFCFKNQLVQDGHSISIRMPNPDDNAIKQVEKLRGPIESGTHEPATGILAQVGRGVPLHQKPTMNPFTVPLYPTVTKYWFHHRSPSNGKRMSTCSTYPLPRHLHECKLQQPALPSETVEKPRPNPAILPHLKVTH